MYGKAVKCDMCERQELVSEYVTDRSTFFDAGFEGWIRITVNKPRDYGWSFRDPKFATTVDSVDCCSISCARDFLNKVHETVLDDKPAESEVPA